MLTSERFPGKREALRRATDRYAALRAVGDFAYAGMFLRCVCGTFNPLSREATANEAWSYVRLSPAAKDVRLVEIDAIVAGMEDAIRERFAR